MNETMSLKQIATNRKNTRKFTGLNTPAGCAVSKMNTLKHGILSKVVLVRSRNRPESSQELTALHERCYAKVRRCPRR